MSFLERMAPAQRRRAALLIVVGMVGGLFLLRLVFDPWSIGLFKPTLLGRWACEYAEPDGRRIAVFMDLTFRDPTGHRQIYNFIGIGQACDAGQRRKFSVDGKTDSYGGERFHLAFTYRDPGPSRRLRSVEGEWRDKLLSLHGELVSLGEKGEIVEPVRWTMDRSGKDVFESACGG